MRLDRSIKAGQYSFRLGTTVPALLRALARGMSGLNLVTIPEGLTTQRGRALLLANHLGVPVAAFDSLGQRPRVPRLARHRGAHRSRATWRPTPTSSCPAPRPRWRSAPWRSARSESCCEATAGRDSLPLGLSLPPGADAGLDRRVRGAGRRRAAAHRARLPEPAADRACGCRPTRPSATPSARRRARGSTCAQLRAESPYNTYLHGACRRGRSAIRGDRSIEAVLQRDAGARATCTSSRAATGGTCSPRTYEEHLRNIRAGDGAAGCASANARSGTPRPPRALARRAEPRSAASARGALRARTSAPRARRAVATDSRAHRSRRMILQLLDPDSRATPRPDDDGLDWRERLARALREPSCPAGSSRWSSPIRAAWTRACCCGSPTRCSARAQSASSGARTPTPAASFELALDQAAAFGARSRS